MSKIRPVAMILGAILLALPSVAWAQATPTKIKLLTQNTGWALMHGRLYWTTDFGQDWRDATPSGVAPHGAATIADVFFLDTSDGWVLLRHGTPGGPYGDWSFDLASTGDGGVSWSVSPVKIPGWDIHRDNMLSGSGTVDFLDPSHGWIDLSLESSAAFNLGALFATTDGGKTWDRMAAPVGFGRVRFLSTQTGWAVGGPGNDTLVVTRNGGRTWQRIEMDAPPQLRPAPLTSYHLPMFRDPKHGVAQVGYPDGGAIALFATDDGGLTWTSIVAVPYQQRAGATATTFFDSKILIARIARRTAIAVAVFDHTGGSRKVTGSIPANSGIVSQLDFRDAQTGWALAGGRLYSTTDGGARWVDATPGSRRSAVTTGIDSEGVQPTPPGPGVSDASTPKVTYTTATASVGGGGNGSSSLHTSAHLGFDSSVLPTHTDMNTWWQSSPYYDVGIYIGGENATQPITKQFPSSQDEIQPVDWVGDVVSHGWGTIPVYAGPQAPCACKYGSGTYPNCNYGTYGSTIDQDLTQAKSQGISEAQSAEEDMANLGLNTTEAVVYLDLEYYNSSYQMGSGTCGQYVQAFVAGWDSQLANDKYSPAVYGSPLDAGDWWNAQPRPADAWIAKADSRATIWGLGYQMTDTNVWGETNRAHQFVQNVNETYGGTPTYKIDRDIEYAQVDGGSGTKSYTFPLSAFIEFGCGNAGINFGGQIDGACGPSPATSYLYSGVNGSELVSGFQVDGETTLAQALNGTSQYCSGPEMVGTWIGGSTFGDGFVYCDGNATTANPIDVSANTTLDDVTSIRGINDDGQMVGYHHDSNLLTNYALLWQSPTDTNPEVIGESRWSGGVDATGINGFGQIVGIYGDSHGDQYGFFYDNGNYTTLTSLCPRGSNTYLTGINNNGQIAGYCNNGTSTNSFLYDMATKTSTPIVGPMGASATQVWGINDKVQLVGSSFYVAGVPQ